MISRVYKHGKDKSHNMTTKENGAYKFVSSRLIWIEKASRQINLFLETVCPNLYGARLADNFIATRSGPVHVKIDVDLDQGAS